MLISELGEKSTMDLLAGYDKILHCNKLKNEVITITLEKRNRSCRFRRWQQEKTLMQVICDMQLLNEDDIHVAIIRVTQLSQVHSCVIAAHRNSNRFNAKTNEVQHI